MHMNSAPHLLTEDRPEFERALNEALRTAHDHPDLAAVGQRLNTEQLRTMALNAGAIITAAAAAEYGHYVKVREELRAPTPSSGVGEPAEDTAVGEAAGTAGAGITAVLTVLAPVLAGTAALIFLLVGYILKMLKPRPAFADTMLTAGWLFGALTAAGILAAAIGLLITALRNSSTQVPAENDREGDELTEEVSRARDAWRHALLERGILPFLRDALADPSADPTSSRPPYRPGGRLPDLGYTRPDFAGPDEGPPAGPRPSFTSPDFTSPDFGGPEHQPE
ncbi:membrane protein [Streptomyces sannanensis]|uniref:Membrane protein n=1 Tax=Streptomyces sannanensis TaxID=285536 RepID=A0ABP6SDF9_9ACTN